ncbi:hypothetical protein FACS1894108_09670 [Planctomycetales bacterium]|nr:hypothetical protein FACS1894108_09670 [Planctomycetales bacterium]
MIRGIGDNLLLLTAAEQYQRKTGEKLTLMTKYAEFFQYADCCYVLLGEHGYPLYLERLENRRHPKINETIKVGKFTLTTKFAVPGVGWHTNAEGNEFWGAPVGKHYLTVMYASLGLTGDIEIAPHLELTVAEKSFGRFSARKQVALMNGGKMRYKSLPTPTMQTIVNQLREKYDFVQIGAGRNEPLTGARNLQGKLTLRQTAAVLANSDLFVGAIGGLMHLARAVECPAVIAYAGEPPELCYYAGNAYVFPDGDSLSRLDPRAMAAAIETRLAEPREFPLQTATI